MGIRVIRPVTQTSRTWCHTFVTPDEAVENRWEIQWQFPTFTLTVTATSHLFAEQILAFVAETRGNPQYRDIPLGGGVYRHMDEKSVDLSPYLENACFKLRKSGESDHGYSLDLASQSLHLRFELHNDALDAFLDGIEDIAEDIDVNRWQGDDNP